MDFFHLGYKPTNHWSIDPFGLTPTMSYLLKLANFTSMAVQRVHYSVKKHFAKEKTLEFMWRPLWRKYSLWNWRPFHDSGFESLSRF